MSSVTTMPVLTEQTTGKQSAGRWMEVLSHLAPRYGGLSATVPALSAAVSETGRTVSIAAFCAPGEEFYPPELDAKQISFWPSSRKTWLLDKSLRSIFEEQLRAADGLHLHGLWEQSTALVARMARQAGKPYVLSAHGMLEPWALGQKRLKKLVYARLLERTNVGEASCLHALTVTEAAQYRAFGATGPIAVIPNGVTIPRSASADRFLELFPDLAGRRIILYLGRLHEKKGLDLLLDAWQEVNSSFPDAHLVLAGPDADGTRARLEVKVAESSLAKTVLFTGMLEAEAKWSALAAATGFVLPSHSEGLSVGVLEAMGMGLPVIVTEGCNMPQVAEYGAGWIIPVAQVPLVASLQALLSQSPVAHQAMGNRGADLIRTQYSWSVVGRQMADVYAWLEQQAPRPQGVSFFEAGEACR